MKNNPIQLMSEVPVALHICGGTKQYAKHQSKQRGSMPFGGKMSDGRIRKKPSSIPIRA